MVLAEFHTGDSENATGTMSENSLLGNLPHKRKQKTKKPKSIETTTSRAQNLVTMWQKEEGQARPVNKQERSFRRFLFFFQRFLSFQNCNVMKTH